MSFGPVFSGMDFYRKAAAEIRSFDHVFLDDPPGKLQFVGGYLEYELIVDGKEHSSERLVGQGSVHVDHGLLNNVRGASLDGRVERHALA